MNHYERVEVLNYQNYYDYQIIQIKNSKIHIRSRPFKTAVETFESKCSSAMATETRLEQAKTINLN